MEGIQSVTLVFPSYNTHATTIMQSTSLARLSPPCKRGPPRQTLHGTKMSAYHLHVSVLSHQVHYTGAISSMHVTTTCT